MPELPEVETVVRGLRGPLIGRTVRAMWYGWPGIIHSPDPAHFAARIAGQTFRAVDRRAKYIVAALDDDLLVIHLRMTGRLYVTPRDAVHDADRWLYFRLDLDNGQQLRFSDARKFGKVYLTDSLARIAPNLGPEPLADDFTAANLAALLAGRRRAIKALLLEQSFIAGVGNIYADEALFLSGVRPTRKAGKLTRAECEALAANIRKVLQRSIDTGGSSISDWINPDGQDGGYQDERMVYARTGQPCKVCGTPIKRITVGQRGTHYCPKCQS